MDVSEYWRNRGPRYFEELQNQPKRLRSRLKDQEDHLVRLLQPFRFNSILEIGCGSGRYTKILYNLYEPKVYTAIDISKEQIENAKKYVSNDKINFQCAQIQNLSLEEKFDLVFASEVLMHIDSKDIDHVIKKLISFSTNKIISIDWFNEKNIGKKLGGYCYMHDYKTLFKKNGAKVVKIHMLPLSFPWKLLSVYTQLRGRDSVETQAIFEVDV